MFFLLLPFFSRSFSHFCSLFFPAAFESTQQLDKGTDSIIQIQCFSTVLQFNIFALHIQVMDPEQKQIPQATQNQQIQLNDKHDQNRKNGEDEKKIPLNKQDQFSEKGQKIQKKQTRSLKPLLQKEPICSFSENFLDDHIEAIRSTMESYVQSLQGISKEFSNIFRYKISLPNKPQKSQKKEEESHLDISENKLMEMDQQNQFKVDLKHERDLEKFLKLITENAPKQLTDQLVYTAEICWAFFNTAKRTGSKANCKSVVSVNKSPLQKSSLSQRLNQRLSQFDQSYQGLFADEKLNCLTLRALDVHEEVARELFMKFIKNYSKTIFCVVNGQFDNPLVKKEHEGEGESDQCSLELQLKQSEAERDADKNAKDQEGISPRKQRKTD